MVLSLSNSRLSRKLGRDEKVARKEKHCQKGSHVGTLPEQGRTSHQEDREATGETMRAPRTAEGREGWTTRGFT